MVTLKMPVLKEVATFVSEKIAPLDAVVSTGTHFISEIQDERNGVF